MPRNAGAIFPLSWIVTQPFSQRLLRPISLKSDMTAKFFFKPLKAKIRSTRRRLHRSLLFGEFSSLKLREWNALSSLSFNLNAMTLCKRNDDARARTGSATQSNAFLVERQSSKRSIEKLVLLRAIRMRHKCEALWHYCKSPLEVPFGKNIADSTSS